MVVAQQAHQFGHANRRVGVVEVDGHLVGEVVERAVLVEVAADQILHRRGDEEVLLAQPQLAAGGRAVVGVEHPRDVLELVLHSGGARVVAGVEGVQIDVRWRDGLPQAQCAHPLSAVTGDDHVVGLGRDLGGMPPHRLLVTWGANVFDPATEVDRVGDGRARELPGRAVCEPWVGILDLASLDDVLSKHAVLVADAVAERRQPERRHRVQEASGQSAQAAIAERRIRLAVGDVLEGSGVCEQALRRGVIQAE